MLKNDFWRRVYNYFFRRITVDSVLVDQRYEAQREYLDHQAAAEHHQALASMYLARLGRLDKGFPTPTGVAATSTPALQRAA